MRKGSNASVAATLLSLLMFAGAWEGLVDNGTNPPPPGNSGSGTGGTVSPPPDPTPGMGTGGSAPVTPAPDAGAPDSGGGAPDTALPGGGTGGAGGGPGAGGAGGASTSECTYPAAPALVDSRFAVGTVSPNLTFLRQDGTSLSFKDIHCNKKNRLLYWAVGGDNCGPCISAAKMDVIPAWKELGPEGLFVLEGFNARNYLVSLPPKDPFAIWRERTMWPPDGDGIAVVKEPPGMPYYYVGRVVSLVIPNTIVIDVATMKVVYKAYHWQGGVAALKSRLAALPMRQ